MILFDNVSKSFNRQLVLKSVNLEIRKGELMVLLGASGSGKTTMLRMVNGLEKPDAGRIQVNNQDLQQTSLLRIRRQIGYVIQKVGLFPHYNVFDNVATVLRLKKIDEPLIKQKVDNWLEKIGMPSKMYSSKFPSELSGGEAQRVGLARALVARPELILLDEPFSALDPITRSELQKEFTRLQRQLGLTIVIVTHDLSEAFTMADEMILLNQGRIEQKDRPSRFHFASVMH